MIKFLEVKRAYYADPENVRVEYWDGSKWWAHHADDPDWTHYVDDPDWTQWDDWRIRPRTIRIGDIDVPEPVREALPIGTKYYYLTVQYTDTVDAFTWQGDSFDKRLLARGLLHLTKEAAVAHAKSLIIVSGGKV